MLTGLLAAGMEAAATLSQLTENEALDAFSKWLSPCGTSNLPPDLKKAFDTFNSVVPGTLVGGKFPKNLIKPGGKGDKTPDQPKEQPKDQPKEQPKDQPTNGQPTNNQPTKDPKDDKKDDKKDDSEVEVCLAG